MKNTLEMLNRMQADGIIGSYAIGGAVGATHYVEPAATVDVDVFVALPTPPAVPCSASRRCTSIDSRVAARQRASTS